MKSIRIAVHCFLFSFEASIFYVINTVKILGLDIPYIFSQIDYYRELPIVNIAIIATSFFAALVVIAINLYKNNRIKFTQFVAFSIFLLTIFILLRSYTVAQIMINYGTEYLFYNLYLYLIGFLTYWELIYYFHFDIEKYLENLVATWTW